MNQIEKQVTSLALSQRLKELGVKQKSLFYWIFVTMPGEQGEWRCAYDWDPLFVREDKVAAFLVGELGDMLPDLIYTTRKIETWYGSILSQRLINKVGLDVKFEAETESDVRAKMLIYLLENGIIKASDL